MTRTYIISSLALFALSAGTTASADPSDVTEARAPDLEAREPDVEAPHDAAHRRDYSRFSDGPRRVPAPRGASFERARRLGLGTRETASRLLHGPARDEWRRAAAWRPGEVERLLWPVDEGRFVRGYGYVRVTRPELIHKGVDISAAEGSVVRAAADGIVAYSDNDLRGYGNCVIIVHPNGWVTLYAHNSRTTVQAGWRVQRGERIALVGSTGISHGPHLHFELRANGSAVDPLALFDDGPLYVRRVVERAAAAGRVPPPRTQRGDRLAPPPLPAWHDETNARTQVAPDEGTGDDDGATGELGGLAIGSARLLRRLLRFRPTDEMAQAAGGRTFRNLLWPMRGGLPEPHRQGVPLVIRGTGASPISGGARPPRLALRARTPPRSFGALARTPIRAAADGLVVYSARVGRRGQSVVLLHRMGWVTVYSGLSEVHVEAGQRVQRGEWIAETERLELEVLVDGRRVDPMGMLVQVPVRGPVAMR